MMALVPVQMAWHLVNWCYLVPGCWFPSRHSKPKELQISNHLLPRREESKYRDEKCDAELTHSSPHIHLIHITATAARVCVWLCVCVCVGFWMCCTTDYISSSEWPYLLSTAWQAMVFGDWCVYSRFRSGTKPCEQAHSHSSTGPNQTELVGCKTAEDGGTGVRSPFRIFFS